LILTAASVAPSAARGAAGEDFYHWIVTLLGEDLPLARGHTGELAGERSHAEATLSAYVDGNGCDGDSAVPKTGPSIPKPNRAPMEAELDKAARGSLASTN
jgi:hypothetical protein